MNTDATTMPMDAHKFNPRDSRREWVMSSNTFTWQDYITVVMVDSGHVAKASIQKLKDGTVWASTRGFSLSNDEIAFLKDGVTDDSRIRQTGLVLCGLHFNLTRTTSGRRIFVGRESTRGCGCVIFLCDKCVVCAIYTENNHPGQCYSLVTQIGDYLLQRGF